MHVVKLCTSDHSVFFSHGKFFDCCHHLIHGFVGERTACVPREVFSKLFLAAFEQLYDHVFAFEFCFFGVIFPVGKEVRPLFARSCRWYGWSPHFLNLSGCLCSRLTSGLHLCAILMDRKKNSSNFVFYIFCLVLAFRVRASLFWHCVFSSWQPFLVVGFCCGTKTTGKQRWRSRHVVRFRCSLCGFQWRETLALVSSRGCNMCTLQLQHWANVRRGLCPRPCLWGSAGLHSTDCFSLSLNTELKKCYW